MKRDKLLENLFNDIKDNIEFDEDVTALATLLNSMLNKNIEISFNSWQYLILKYDINTLIEDINFTPLIKTYTENFLLKVGSKTFFKYMINIPSNKLDLIYKNIFNIYNNDCIVYKMIENYLKSNNLKAEKNFIEDILNNSNSFPKTIYNKTDLIKRIIIIHLNNNNIPEKFLKELINKVESKKEKAILKTLLIDYDIDL